MFLNFCCITKYHNLGRLKQHTFVILPSLGWESGHSLLLVLYFRVSREALIKVSAMHGRFSVEGSMEKDLLPKLLTCLLAEFSSFWAVGLGTSVPSWLVFEGQPQFLVS